MAMDPTAAMAGLDIFTKLGANAILGWIVWYMLSRAVPNLVEKFVADTGAARAAYLANETQSREAFMAELKAGRETFAAEMAAQRAECRQELDRILQLVGARPIVGHS
jgi:hypothetical protein